MGQIWDLFISVFVNVLIWIYDVVGNNFGLAIILFTILIRIVTWPLNAANEGRVCHAGIAER